MATVLTVPMYSARAKMLLLKAYCRLASGLQLPIPARNRSEGEEWSFLGLMSGRVYTKVFGARS